MTDTMAKLVLTRVHDHGLGCIDAEDRRWSWAEMVTRGATVGAVLRTMADPDQPLHVGVLLPNTLDYLDWLIGAALVGATIVGGSFPQAKLVKANFGQGKLSDLDLSGADLRDADFTGAILRGVKFDGADLRGVRGLGDNA